MLTREQKLLWAEVERLAYEEAAHGDFVVKKGRVVEFRPTLKHQRAVAYMATIADMDGPTCWYEMERFATFGLDVFT